MEKYVLIEEVLKLKTFTKVLKLGDKKNYFYDLCSVSSWFALLMRINNIKLELKIKRTRQVILANQPEAASVSVHERA